MKTQLSALILLGSVMGYAHAQSEVYVCMNDNGTKEYKNTGATKGCKRIDLQGVTMIPSPYKKPLVQTVAARSTSSPAEFPRIDSGMQKARDNDRMQILLNEMKTEEQKLANLKKEFNNGEPERQGNEKNYAKYQERVASMKEDMNRAEKNIEALKREIGNLK
jgi:septal ring factor EnvC (AmiA/AmiB activator)